MACLSLDGKIESAPRVEGAKVRVHAPDGRTDRTTASFGLWPWVRLAVSKGHDVEHFCELAGIEQSAVRDLGVHHSQPVSNRVAQLAIRGLVRRRQWKPGSWWSPDNSRYSS
jgi:hypothetical protein